MAYQPKSYRKFLAGTVTAAVVATAVAPAASAAFNDVPATDSHAENIATAVELGLINGFEDGTFKPYQDITRGQVAKIIARYLGEVDTTGVEQFTDVEDGTELAEAALTVRAAGVFTGSNGALNWNKPITRQEMATVLVRLFGLEDLADKESAVTDIDSAWSVHRESINILSENGVTTVTEFNPLGNVKRGQFASFTVRAIETVPVDAEVVSVSAINSTTLELTGVALDEFTAEDITVEGNTIISYKAAEDGKTATLKLGSALVPDTEYAVTVNTGDDESVEFSVTYNLEVTTVSVDAKSFDDDTEDQFVSFKVNGKTADVNDLFVNGYSVEFAATTKEAGVTRDATGDLFADENTGELKTGLTAGTKYKVQVTISKGSDVFVSEQAEIEIKNFELVAASIESYELTNTTANDIIQKSSTFVVGDVVDLTELVAIQNGKKTTLDAVDIAAALADGTLDIKSSNPAVVSVDDAEFTANTPGNATITITYGSVKQTISVKVASEEREVTKVVPKSTSLTTILSPVTNNTLEFHAFDQYGDPIVLDADTDEITVQSSKESVATVAVSDTDVKGKGTLTVTPAELGSTSVVFKNEDGKTIGSVAVKVTDNASASKTVLEIVKPSAAEIEAGQSEDATIDAFDENEVVYKLQPYTSEGVKLDAKDMAGYTVKFDEKIVNVNSDTDGLLEIPTGTAVTELSITLPTTVKVGYSDIAVYNAEGALVSKVRVTVVNNTPKLSAVTLKSIPEVTFAGKTIDYKSVLNITSSSGDDIVNGVTLTHTANSVIRIDEDSAELYIDKNGDGDYTDETTDTKLGTVAMAAVSGNTGLDDFTGAILTGATTDAGDEGTIIITVKNNDSTPKIVSSTSITVKVPE